MFLTLSLFVFIFGTIVGSFLNVVALRYNTGLSFARGRSQCFSCGKGLSWRELIPVWSYIVLRGKCSKCASKISVQYLLVELATGALFLATFIHVVLGASASAFTFVHLATIIYYFFIWSILIVISVYDFRHKIIPDALVFLFCFATFVASLISFFYFHNNTILDIFAGPILAMLPFGLLWLVSGGRWIGLGDAKLALGIGFMLGFVGGVSAVVLAFWIGAVVSIVLIGAQRVLSLSSKNLTMKSEIPFGPFLILGTIIIFFFSFDVMGLSAIFGF